MPRFLTCVLGKNKENLTLRPQAPTETRIHAQTSFGSTGPGYKAPEEKHRPVDVILPIIARPSHIPAMRDEPNAVHEEHRIVQPPAPGVERKASVPHHRLTPPPEEQEEQRETTMPTAQKRGSWGQFGDALRGKGDAKPREKVLTKASKLVEHPVGGLRY